MPEEITIAINVKSALDNLEYNELDNHHAKQDYSTILKVLESQEILSLKDTERLLAICVHDLKERVNLTIVIEIITAIISRVKMHKYDQSPDLVPSALAVINVLSTTALLNKVDSLKVLCYDVLLSYPDDTLVSLIDHEEVMELFILYFQLTIPINLRTMACSFLHRLLIVLPPETKKSFVTNGYKVWFSKFIPLVMALCYTDVVETLELLTESLVDCDYVENQEWQNLLENICSGYKYPATMKKLLENGNDLWHRLWIIFIKLLKHQVTQLMTPIGTPINSMLPVVEAAFKLDFDNRCKAFECWNALIDSFSNETNESNINKRIKLLIIPLKSNNAKSEETALAKFKCWWHLMHKFQNKIDKFLDIVLLSFLHFCFGKHSNKTLVVPGQMSLTLKKLSLQGLVDLVGHVHCEGCTELPKLSGKMINTTHLVDNWVQWVFSLSSSILLSANIDEGLTKQQMSCLWKSFHITIGELPENNIRRDLFAELLSILTRMIQKECKNNAKLADYAFNVLLLSYFDENSSIKPLLNSKSDINDPLFRIILCLLDQSLEDAYQGCSMTQLILKLQPVTRTIMDQTVCSPNIFIDWLLKVLPRNDIGLGLWTALLESFVEFGYDICPQALCYIMMWPLKSINVFSDIKPSAIVWYKTYDLFHIKLSKSEMTIEINKYLAMEEDLTESSTYFKMSVLLAVLKEKLIDDKCNKCEKEIDLLQNLTNHIDCYGSYEELFPILVDRVLSVLNIQMKEKNQTVGRQILHCINKLITVMARSCTKDSEVSNISVFIESLLRPLAPFEVKTIMDDLTEQLSSEKPLLKSTILSLVKKYSSRISEDDNKYKALKPEIDKIENITQCSENDLNSDKNKFTSPKVHEVKKTKKKEATTDENGEEYVVVKSNWKFNPRKLTENQKEKFQRRREDIPALYQDLSQSQDDFKLASWKTDSQDTSNSSKSESKSLQSVKNETNTELLKNLPSSNVVPKILETFFSTNDKNDSPKNSKDDLKNNGVKFESTPKTTKSPRMALKDRVSQHVRNLIEKSGELQKENKEESSASLNKTVNLIKTPTQCNSNNSANVMNSAPPLLSSDRPTRVKRKPKKFDEHLLGVKRSRLSSMNDSVNNQSQQDIPKEASETANIGVNVEGCAPNIRASNDNKKNHDKTENVVIVIPSSNDVIDENKQEPVSKCNKVQKTPNKNNPNKTIEEAIQNNLDTAMDIDATTIDNINDKLEENVSEKQNESALGKKKMKSKDKKIEKSIDIKEINLQPDKNKCDSQHKSNEKNETEKSEAETNKMTVDQKDKTLFEEKNDKSENNVERNQSRNKNISINKDPEHNNEGTESSVGVNRDTPKDNTEPISENKTKTKASTPVTKRKYVRKSRIEKELAIDMVEGHPFLKMQTEKRLTRKTLESTGTGRRKSLVEKLNKSKSEVAKLDKKAKDKKRDSDSSSTSVTVDESQEKDSQRIDHRSESSPSEDLPYSDDVIESSQDSTMTTVSTKSIKKNTTKKLPIVSLQKMKLNFNEVQGMNESQSILDSVIVGNTELATGVNQDSKDDIELPLNKTLDKEKTQVTQNLTENMDTEPMDDNNLNDSVVVLSDAPPITISSDECVGPETQEIAEADTQPNNPEDFVLDNELPQGSITAAVNKIKKTNKNGNHKNESETLNKTKSMSEKSLDDETIILSDSPSIELENENGASSPSSFRDEAQRKQDFLNNTIEISPIKSMSPDRHKKSPSPETSSDYVVIKLSSPVHINGEPFEKCGSPEVFTDDKASPDKRDQSPPRGEVTVSNGSPSSSLSLKKNRPQVRSGGRAAQMLGLCVPNNVQPVVNLEKTDNEEVKKSSLPARRNLRILYNSVSDITENTSENEDSEQFLKLRRSLPAVDCSPSGPILKRKLIEICDDATVSPVSKRKRVSFHDPPVSTTVSVQKYIEPAGVRSPQNSAQKRLERQMRQHTPLKSPKRLDNVFKLDNILTKTIESFIETENNNTPDDTQNLSLDETPVVEIVRASELNDIDPICPELVDCKDLIDNIASELSSSAMKSLLVKELAGKVETVGDLAKMTELEVNRLCIKAPKVKVAKKVLSDYVSKRVDKTSSNLTITVDEGMFEVPMTEGEQKSIDMEMQTDKHETSEIEVQTDGKETSMTYAQTDSVPTVHTSIQTDETGSKSTADIVKLCLAERPDFVTQVSEHLEESSIKKMTEKLPFSSITDLLMERISPSHSPELLKRILKDFCNTTGSKKSELLFIQNYLCEMFDSKDLVLFCSELLKSVYEKPA